ncbi:MAG: hypothetical protein WDN30_03400 [Pararobbsia sp.]
MSDDDYARSHLGVYERLDTHLAADLFAWTYRRSIARYGAQRDAAGLPDPFRARHREAISEAVAQVVRDREPLAGVIAGFPLEVTERALLMDLVTKDLAKLGEHNFARYRLSMKQLENWIRAGRPVEG